MEVADYVYETLICEEFRHLMAPKAPRFVDIHVQVSKDNGVPE